LAGHVSGSGTVAARVAASCGLWAAGVGAVVAWVTAAAVVIVHSARGVAVGARGTGQALERTWKKSWSKFVNV